MSSSINARHTIPQLAPSRFIVDGVLSNDRIIAEYAVKLLELEKTQQRTALSAWLTAMLTEVRQILPVLQGRNSDDNLALYRNVLVLANALQTSLATALATPAQGPAPAPSRRRRITRLTTEIRLVGIIMEFARVMSRRELSPLLNISFGPACKHLWAADGPLAVAFEACKVAIDDAALSPLEMHQAKAGANEANFACLSMFADCLDVDSKPAGA